MWELTSNRHCFTETQIAKSGDMTDTYLGEASKKNVKLGKVPNWGGGGSEKDATKHETKACVEFSE